MLSVVIFSKTTLIFEKISSKYLPVLPISRRLGAWTLGSFSFVVFHYKNN